jgi:hypothetical protein
MLQDVSNDIFAFGLCMLELLTLKQLDPQHCVEVPQLLQQVRRSNDRPMLCRSRCGASARQQASGDILSTAVAASAALGCGCC